MTKKPKESLGVNSRMLRLAVGIEDYPDLQEELETAIGGILRILDEAAASSLFSGLKEDASSSWYGRGGYFPTTSFFRMFLNRVTEI